MIQINSLDNGLSLAKKGVQYAPRLVALVGIQWFLGGIYSSGMSKPIA